MRILCVADEECPALWDYYTPGRLADYDLILSFGDLKPEYLSFLVTMGRAPLLYVHGNHDANYAKTPPEGCENIDGHLVVWRGVRILGLGGVPRCRPGTHQYTEREMRRRIAALRRALKKAGGVDIVVAHAPPLGLGDLDDPAHRGFAAFTDLLERYRPQYFLHGHIHLRYAPLLPRERLCGGSRVINVSERFELTVPDRAVPPERKNELVWMTRRRREAGTETGGHSEAV